MSQSDRAIGRVRELRADILGRLRGHVPLTDRLEAVDGVTEGTEVIAPAPWLGMQHRSDTADPPAVALAVTVVTASSARENLQERTRMVVQTDLQIRTEALRGQGLAWHDETLDEVAAVLTAHTAGWTAQGATGGTPEPLWEDQRNRYRSVQRFDIMSWG